MAAKRVFHVKNGWTFERTGDGAVTVCTGAPRTFICMEPSEWASVVASMSKIGETGETWIAALRFHG